MARPFARPLLRALLLSLALQAARAKKGADVGNTGPTPLADAALAKYPPGDRRFSVLSRANFSNVGTKPYEHILVMNALEPELYAALEEAYPPLSKLMSLSAITTPKSRVGSNVRRDIPAQTSLKGYNAEKDKNGELKGDGVVHRLWQRFVEYHISDLFYEDLSRLAGQHIAKKHGAKYVYGNKGYRYAGTRTYRPMPGAKTQTHMAAHSGSPSIDMDCQISFNTPVTKRSAVRGAHIDSAQKIFGALFYFKHAEDKSHGGDFNLYSCKKPCKPLPQNRIKTGNGHKAHTMYSPRDVHVAKVAPYSANTFVLFINSKMAVHGVSPRSVTKYPRRLINFIANRM